MKTFFFNALSIDEDQDYVQFNSSNIERNRKLDTFFYDDTYPIGVNNASHWYRSSRLYRKNKISRK